MLEKAEEVEEDTATCDSTEVTEVTEDAAEVEATTETEDAAVVETMTEEEEEEAAALIWNGKDHWKVLASESRKMAMP